MKTLDLTKTVAELVGEYPELKDTMAEENLDKKATPAASRQDLLKSMIDRLSSGEDPEKVKADFVKNFSSVSAHEISDAEQALIRDGMPVAEAQKLCDIHSSLFHGKTEAEIMREEEDALLPAGHPVLLYKEENKVILRLSKETDAALSKVEQAIETEALTEYKNAVKDLVASYLALKPLRQHYGQKEELIMPLLEHYGVSGPGKVMWGVDDEIKQELGSLISTWKAETDPEKTLLPKEEYVSYLAGRSRVLTRRIREMIYKEENILFPMALEHFTKEEWYGVYRDVPEMGYSFVAGEKVPAWPEAESWARDQEAKGLTGRTEKLKTGTGSTGKAADTLDPAGLSRDARVRLSTGELTVKELEAIFALLPVDVTFIDGDDTVRFFTEKLHVFSRPLSALGRKVYSCHPPRLVPVVRAMIDDFKAGRRDSEEVWIPKPGSPTRVTYLAVRGEDGTYVGTLELVETFGDVIDHLKDPKMPKRPF